LVPRGIAADLTDVAITQAEALATPFHFLFKVQDTFGQLFGIVARRSQQMQGQAFGRFLTNSREFGDLLNGVYNGWRIIVHFS
jgi:hypothetical protein